ncbi:MAG: RNA polymerase sigma-70 factor [Flavisolibacter sp.]
MKRYPSDINFTLVGEQSFISFYRNHYTSFCFFANRFVNNLVIAEDIVGDIALKLWEKRGELENIGSFKAYFYTSIRNACLNWINKEQSKLKNETAYKASALPIEQTTLENIIRTETFRELETAIHSLPAQCRRIFIKLFIEGKSLSETAEEMKLSLFTVKAQRQRGIKLLRKQLIGPLFFLWIIFLFLQNNPTCTIAAG